MNTQGVFNSTPENVSNAKKFPVSNAVFVIPVRSSYNKLYLYLINFTKIIQLMRLSSTSKSFIATLFFFAIFNSSYSQDYKIASSLPVGDSKSFIFLQTDRKSFGFGLLNSTGAMEWQIDLPDRCFDMAKLGEDVVVFYAERGGNLSPIKAIHAVLVGVKNKKILLDKIIYKNPDKFLIEPNVLCDPRGNFTCLLVRTTAYRPGLGGFGGNEGEKRMITQALTRVAFENDLESQVKDIKSLATESVFMATCAGDNKDFYIFSYSGDQVLSERFDSNGNVVGKLSVDISRRRKTGFNYIIQYDSIQVNCIDFALSYINDQKDHLVQLFRFDFNNNKTNGSEQVPLNKEYVNSLKPADNSSKLRHFGAIANLNPVEIIESNDKIILLKEIQSASFDGSTTKHIREGSIISVYTKDLKLLREVAIEKWSANFLEGFDAIAGHLKGDKLYAVTNEQNGLGFKTILYVININDGSIKTKEIEEKESGINWLTIPGDILWYEENFLIPFTKGKPMVHLNPETSIVSEKY